MMIHVRIASLSLILAVIAMIGCESTAPPAAGPDPVSAAAYPQVTAAEPLDDWLVVGKPIVEAGRDNRPMQVTVPVRLQRDRGVNAQYRILFLDERGRPVGPEPEWRYLVLPARTQMFLEGTALDPAAVDWRAEVRPARQ